ncbi:MAG: excinuclease ABC subunit UvrA [Puniceicoccales bacterium]|jgi:excinuclease ABC subunit A|nr:excinuclease ABC subunit UvrA [Puniceicoccales bacterium]
MKKDPGKTAPSPPAPPKARQAPPAVRGPGIVLRGAREHNLRNVDVDIPHNVLAVVTGVSGSGKSTLAFDVLFAEGQRRFLECMSPYARQFVEQLPRPELDHLSGVPPSVAIEQRVTRGGAKSTVATVTEIAQYLRLLYARAATARNPATGAELTASTPEMLRGRVRAAAAKAPVLLCPPLVRDRKGHHQPLADWAARHGHERLRVDGRVIPTIRFKPLERYRTHDIEVVFAEIPRGGEPEMRVLEEALRLGGGACLLASPSGKLLEWLSITQADPRTGESFPALEPKLFSWNSPRGWCPACRGHGRVVEQFANDEDGHLHDVRGQDRLSGEVCPGCGGTRLNPFAAAATLPLAGGGGERDPHAAGGSITLPALLALPPPGVASVLSRLGLDPRGRAIAAEILPEIHARLRFLEHAGLAYLALDRPADTLSGGEAQRIRLAAQLGSNLSGALYVLDEPSIGLHPRDNALLIKSLKELRDRGNTVLVVEHDEETMRAADLVLDLGPGAGIHGGRLLACGPVAEVEGNPDSLTARHLREAIPHPVRGHWRGDLPGAPALVLVQPRLRNLRGGEARFPLGRLTVVCGVSGSGKSTLARDLLVPAATAAARLGLGRISGRRLLREAAFPAGGPCRDPAGRPPLEALSGVGAIRQVILVGQDPIGKTPRSTPATYIGAFDRIRGHFASLPEARMRGHGAGFFSFNTDGGRCPVCAGAGRVRLEMSFLPDTHVPCEECGGDRYGAAADLRWNGRTIGEVLRMTFEEAAAFFAFDRPLREILDLMVSTGLGYLQLGQPSPTLSGGEAQRLKLVSELARGIQQGLAPDGAAAQDAAARAGRGNLYVLEEPTIGLHQADCARLIQLLHALVDQGHTVVVIEHHLDLVAEADHVIELGPEGGAGGGVILHQGTVDGLLAADTPTAPFLRNLAGLRRPPGPPV